MNKENMMKWVAALRSGKYAQTKEILRDEKGFCCWGVMCDISGVGGWNDITIDRKAFLWKAKAGVGMPPVGLPEELLGVSVETVGVYDRYDRAFYLDDLNDSGEFTFDQLADLIETHVNGWDLSIRRE